MIISYHVCAVVIYSMRIRLTFRAANLECPTTCSRPIAPAVAVAILITNPPYIVTNSTTFYFLLVIIVKAFIDEGAVKKFDSVAKESFS